MMLLPETALIFIGVLLAALSCQTSDLFVTWGSGSGTVSTLPSSHYSDAQEPIFDPDNGGGLSFEEDKPRLDKFARRFLESPEATAYIFAYGGLRGPKGEAKKRLICIRQHFRKTHLINSSRLIMMDGGYRSEIEVELFLVRPGDPTPEPFPTVKPSRVRFIKSKKRPCS